MVVFIGNLPLEFPISKIGTKKKGRKKEKDPKGKYVRSRLRDVSQATPGEPMRYRSR